MESCCMVPFAMDNNMVYWHHHRSSHLGAFSLMYYFVSSWAIIQTTNYHNLEDSLLGRLFSQKSDLLQKSIASVARSETPVLLAYNCETPAHLHCSQSCLARLPSPNLITANKTWYDRQSFCIFLISYWNKESCGYLMRSPNASAQPQLTLTFRCSCHKVLCSQPK